MTPELEQKLRAMFVSKYPDLVDDNKEWRRYLHRFAKAQDANAKAATDETQEAEKAAKQQQTEEYGGRPIEAGLRSLQRDISFGFDDDIYAAGVAAKRAIFNGGNFSDDYTRLNRDFNEETNKLRTENRPAALLGSAGSLFVPGLGYMQGAKALAQGAGKGAALLQGAKTGGILGGGTGVLSGVGHTDFTQPDAANRAIHNAFTGGAIGVGAGTVLGGVGGALASKHKGSPAQGEIAKTLQESGLDRARLKLLEPEQRAAMLLDKPGFQDLAVGIVRRGDNKAVQTLKQGFANRDIGVGGTGYKNNTVGNRPGIGGDKNIASVRRVVDAVTAELPTQGIKRKIGKEIIERAKDGTLWQEMQIGSPLSLRVDKYFPEGSRAREALTAGIQQNRTRNVLLGAINRGTGNPDASTLKVGADAVRGIGPLARGLYKISGQRGTDRELAGLLTRQGQDANAVLDAPAGLFSQGRIVNEIAAKNIQPFINEPNILSYDTSSLRK